jgi:hypothetical protein
MNTLISNQWMLVSAALALLAYSPASSFASDVTYSVIDPVSGDENKEQVNQEKVPLVAAKNLVEVINRLFSSDSTTRLAFYKYFGVEPEGRGDQYVPSGESPFLMNCKILFGEEWGKVRLSLSGGEQAIRSLGASGDYSFYAANLTISNSDRFKTGILFFRTETFDDNGSLVVSSIPSNLYLGR